jgi:hypothetical protein
MSGGSHSKQSFVHSDLFCCCCTLGFLTEFYGPVKSTPRRLAMPNAALPQKEKVVCTIEMSFVDTLDCGWAVFTHTHTHPIKNDKLFSIRIGCKMWYLVELFSVKSPCLHPIFGSPFHPLTPFSVKSAKYKEFLIKSGCEMLKLSISCTRWFESNFSSCTGRSSENICSTTSGGLMKKEREVSTQDEIQFTTPKKKWCFFWVYLPLNAKCTFLQVFFCFESHPVLDQTPGGSGAGIFLTLRISLVRGPVTQ